VEEFQKKQQEVEELKKLLTAEQERKIKVIQLSILLSVGILYLNARSRMRK
jgi:hypothetical protein